MSLTFASQLTAIATLALAILALITAIFAGLAFRKQSREVSDQAEMLKVQSEQLAEDRKVNAEQIRVLGLQAEELGQVAADREREALEKVRAQANQISAWTWSDPPNSWFEVVNRSDLPVYHLVILTDSSNIEKPANFNMGNLSGQESFKASLQTQSKLDSGGRKRAVPVCFMDAAGRRWLRDGLGILYEGTKANIQAVQYPNGIVGGAATARRFYDRAD